MRDALDPRSVGLMMRPAWHRDVLAPAGRAMLDWIELYPENYALRGPLAHRAIDELASVFPISLHTTALSFGSIDEVPVERFTRVADLAVRTNARWIGDHLSCAFHAGENLHELVPIPFSSETIRLVARSIARARRLLDRPILIENTAYYFQAPGTDRDEAAFLAELLEVADADLLLDVNNLYVNARNHGFDPLRVLDVIPPARVRAIHLGGFTIDAPTNVLVDSHAAPPTDEVIALLEVAVARFGPRPVLLEWEANLPPFEGVLHCIATVRDAVSRASPVREGDA